MADDPKASWGRINLDYDVAEAKAEGDRLRAEFDNALKLMDEDPEWPMNTLNKEQQQDWPRPPSDKREAPRDFKVIAPGLKKRTTKRRATDGPATPARWGDVVAVALRARVATARDPFSDLERADVLVGALAVPKCLSWAAASLVVGERATFEAASACAFGDPKRADADLPDGVAASDDIVLDLELLQVVRPVGQGDAPVHDASGPLGAGAVLKVVEAKGEGWRTPTARSDVTYSATARFTPDAWAWPGDEDATTLVGGCSAEILDDAPRESRGTWNPAASCVRTDPLRLACEAMATGERCVAAVRAKGEAWALRLIDFAEHEDCSPADRPGSVTKRTVRRSSGAAGFPNDLDVVEVRGLVKNADGVVACCYGSAVGDAPGEAGEAVFWRLDEDARASFVSAPGALFAPLCRGLELAVKRMTVGEVADVSVRAPDLGFVRPPSTAKAPLEPRLDDMAAFHYGGVDGANSSVADARCYGAGLEARLELVSVARHGDGLAATVLSDPLKRAEQFLDLADEAKALGAAHYKRGAFARAARRYGAAVAAAAVAATALETVQPEGLRFDPEDATGFAYREAMKHATAPDTVAGELDLTGMPKPEGYGEKREPLPDPPTEHQSARNQAYATANARGSEILRACRLNRAACGLKRCTYKTVCDDCHAVLQDHPNDLKALYRGGRALIGVKDYDGARSLFERCLDLDKSCAEAKRGVRDVDRLVKGEGQTKGGFRPLKGLAVAGGGFGCDSRGKWHDRDAGDDGAPSAKKKPVVNPSVDKRTGYGQMAASREMLAMMEDDDVSGVD